MEFLQLFYVFFKIGIVGFGGGYAMISLIQFDVVDTFKWMSASEFSDVLAVSQMTPGPISINTATYVGYTVGGVLGSIVATIALCLPSVIMMYFVIRYLMNNKENKYVQAIMSGLRPVLGGLILSAALLLLNKDSFCDFGWGENNVTLAIFITSFVALYFYKVNAMLLLIISGGLGFLLL